MILENEQPISAQVVLPSASGRAIDADTMITSENIEDYVPSPETVTKATEAFADMGFEVGEMVGISFSITAPANTFEEAFAVQLYQEEKRGVMAYQEDRPPAYEIPVSALPQPVAEVVVSVTFVPPPDFGPTEFFGP